MISFATLFLGLVFGVVGVRLDVAAEVSSARLLVDGHEVARVAPPWKAAIDLGPALWPHELVAVALGPDGRELGRARQWINRPRGLAEAGFFVEPGEGGEGRVARLTWRCLVSERPRASVVTFDGRRLAVPDPSRFVLPPHVPEQLHVLHAELDFGEDVTAVADATFGGTRRAEALSDLTAFPVTLSEGATLPPPPGLDGWLARRGQPLRVVAVEEGPARVVFVAAGDAPTELVRLEATLGDGALRSRTPTSRSAAGLGRDRAFRFVGTVPRKLVRRLDEVEIFPGSREFTAADGGLLHVGAHLDLFDAEGGERIAQAVATAGLSAAARDRRRAVVLLIGRHAAETGSLPPAEALAFLERLRVPFQVWALAGQPAPLAARFGPVVDASTRHRLERAVSSLGRSLDRQRVVWVEGSLLPHEIEPTARAKGIAPAR